MEISINNIFVRHNASVFPESCKFFWLKNPRLDHYMVAFVKGARAYLGINLAYAKLYMGLGGIFKRFGVRDFQEGCGDSYGYDLTTRQEKEA